MTNEELDAMVLAAITREPSLVLRGVEMAIVGAGARGFTSRQVDRSLQRLRKAGKIVYGGPGTSFTGWRVWPKAVRRLPPVADDGQRHRPVRHLPASGKTSNVMREGSAMTTCVCGQVARARCPRCGAFVCIEGGKFAVHDAGVCTGSHMEYGTCKQSGKVPREVVIHQKTT